MKLVTGNVWEKVNSEIRKSSKIDAAIAYVTATNLGLKKGDTLICDASVNAIKNGETSAKALEYYYKKGVSIFSKKNLHAKVFRTSNLAVIGSANLSKSSAKVLVEGSVISRDKSMLAQLGAFIYAIKKGSKPLGESEINKLKEIPVIRRGGIAFGKRKHLENFGSNNWIIPVHDLTEKVLIEEEQITALKTKQVSKKMGVREGDISFIRFVGKHKFVTKAKPGDRLLQLYRARKSKRVSVLSFCPILDKEKIGNTIWFYCDARDVKEISWTQFSRKGTKLELIRPVKRSSFRTISESDAILIDTVFR